MNRTCAIAASGLLLASILPARQQEGYSPVTSTVIVGEEAALLLQPQAVGVGGAVRAEWSPTGKSVLLVRQKVMRSADVKSIIESGGKPNEDDLAIVLSSWNRSTGKSADLIKRNGRFREMVWFAGSDVAFAQWDDVDRETGSQATRGYFVYPLTQQVRNLVLQPGESIAAIEAHPTKPNLMVATNLEGSDEAILTLLDASGQRLARVSRPAAEFYSWTPDGSALVAMKPRARGETNAKPVLLALNWTTGATTEMEFRREDWKVGEADKSKPSLSVELGTAPALPGERRMKSWYLVSNSSKNPNRALVAADADWAVLSKQQDAVLYSEMGVPIVREIARFPEDFYRKQLEAAKRTAAMSNAKQSALAMIMYASDYDDMLPFDQSGWLESVLPYAKNRDILSQFVYTYSGDRNLANAGNPAETELGYIEGPGGRAVAYLDGHVRWVPNPTSTLAADVRQRPRWARTASSGR